MFKDKGAVALDADEIVRRAYQDKSVRRKIKKVLGAEILGESGQLDKKKISEVVFASATKRKKLESILHPIVR
jgi:dephospho-CoA kinase